MSLLLLNYSPSMSHHIRLRLKQPQVGSLIRQMRSLTQQSQIEFAAALGMSYSAVNRWENGHCHPSAIALRQIWQILDQLSESTDAERRELARSLMQQYFPQIPHHASKNISQNVPRMSQPEPCSPLGETPSQERDVKGRSQTRQLANAPNRPLEEALQRSEERFQIAIETLMDAFATLSAVRDESGQIIDFQYERINAAGCASMQMPASQLLGQKLCHLFPAHRETGLFDDYCQVVTTGQPLVRKGIVYHDWLGQQHLKRVFDVQATRLDDGLAIAWRERTSSQPPNSALQWSEEWFRTIFELAPIGISMADPQTHRFVRVNRAFQDMLGYTPAELAELTVEDVTYPDDIGVNALQAQQLLKGKLSRYHAKKRYVTKDGRIIWLSITATPLRDPYTNRLYVLGMVEDITDHNQAEIALRQSEIRLRLALEAAQMGVWDYNMLTGEEIWTANSEAIMGFAPGTFDGNTETFLARVHPDDRERVRNSHLYVTESGISHFEFRVIDPDNQTRWIASRGQVFYDEAGCPFRMTGVDMDVTQRKQAEEQLRASLEEKNILLQEIHHRVKNNLQTVSSLLRLQSNMITNPLLLEMMQDGQNRVRAMALIHEKLYQSHNLARINFTEYVQSLIDELCRSYQVDLSKIQVQLTIAPIEFGVSLATPCGLILNELISNAFKHAFPGDRTGILQVQFTCSGDRYCLVVQDDGIGLPQNFLSGQNRSLGLRLVNSLIHQLRGTLDIDPENGTRFTLTFPICTT